MSVLQSIMDFIQGREQAAPPVDVPSTLPQTAPQAGDTPQPRESYMPDNSNKNYVNKAWKDRQNSRAIKSLVKKAEEAEERRFIEQGMKENLDNEVVVVPDREIGTSNPRRKVQVTDATVPETKEEKRKRDEARYKALRMREP